jgi:peptidoglycan hydrolase-like protein with peptidoglycan-binding domain
MGAAMGRGRRLAAGALTLAVAFALLGVAAPPAVAATPQTYHAMNPVRLMDTRAGIGGPAVALGQGESRALAVRGRGGVPATATAVVLNVTITAPTAPTFLTVWPAGAPKPTSSNLNAVGGQTVANMVTVGLGVGGRILLYNFLGATHVVVDVAGWYSGGFRPIVPRRVMDTRVRLGGPGLGAAQVRPVDLRAAGVPANAVAVVANVTAVNISASGYLTVYPSGAVRPTASNVNTVPGQTVANMVTVGLGRNGRIAVFNYAGHTDVVVDVAGWYTSGFHPVVPNRLADTRVGRCGTRLGPGQTLKVAVVGHGGVPAGTTGAVALNVTVVNPTSPTYLTVFPSGAMRPRASNVNAIVGTVPNAVTTGLGLDGRVAIYNYAGTVDVVVDVSGWFNGDPRVRVPVSAGCSGTGGVGRPHADLAVPASEPLIGLRPGASGPAVAALQRRLTALGFWVADADGSYGPVTTQAVIAFQKYLGLPLTGRVDDLGALLLNMSGLRAAGASTSGDRIEVNLSRQLLFVVRGGHTRWTVNTSTGTGAFYSEPNQLQGGTIRGHAITPVGFFHVYSDYSAGWQPGQLGELYRPKYFSGGVAVHGAPRIPKVPASHGCVRVTTSFMDYIWAQNYMPIGEQVWTHY